MSNVQVTITDFLDDAFPGFVRFEFVDSDGTPHRFTDKVPIVSLEHLDVDSGYPRPGSLRCTVVRRDGNRVEIDTNEPDSVESTKGETRFVVDSPRVASV